MIIRKKFSTSLRLHSSVKKTLKTINFYDKLYGDRVSNIKLFIGSSSSDGPTDVVNLSMWSSDVPDWTKVHPPHIRRVYEIFAWPGPDLDNALRQNQWWLLPVYLVTFCIFSNVVQLYISSLVNCYIYIYGVN